jgi:hypothetical protein
MFGRLFRTRVLARFAALAMRFDAVRLRAFRTISQIGISYPRSQLSSEVSSASRNAPRAGERFPWMHLKFLPGTVPENLFGRLDDTRFNLLVFGQAAPTAEEIGLDRGLLDIHVAPSDPTNTAQLRRFGIPLRACYLLRPDGHIGLCGKTVDVARLAQYFHALVGHERHPLPTRSLV